MPAPVRNEWPDFGRDVEALRTMFKRLPTVAGNMAVNFFKDSFRREGFIDKRYTRWKPRAHQQKGGGRRRLLTRSGDLQRSINFRPGQGEFRVFSDKQYAQIHNEGGRIRITPRMRGFFWYQFRRTKDEFWKGLALTKKTHIDIPKRQYMGESEVLDKRIETHVVRFMDKIFMS